MANMYVSHEVQHSSFGKSKWNMGSPCVWGNYFEYKERTFENDAMSKGEEKATLAFRALLEKR